ncbi:hypothetical protein ACG9XY_12490 [Acinetobacter seifertii]|uniref:hypothetical protein n=1 Tax=Acinetobacter seifertii TaxID=1530123 RepID=UPI002940B91E|nr:hypothetical protein [Acinetobacter seifertii]MDV4263339.1 hypothetical protein [Acinetobacter seifertii]
MALTKEQKDFILQRLDNQFSSVKLKCDEYEVSLYLTRVQNLKLAIEIFVNGYFKMTWLLNPDQHPESKYYPNGTQALFKPSAKAKLFKEFGKRRAYKFFPNLDEVITFKRTHFSTARAALTHLIKVSDSIELITEMKSETALT